MHLLSHLGGEVVSVFLFSPSGDLFVSTSFVGRDDVLLVAVCS